MRQEQADQVRREQASREVQALINNKPVANKATPLNRTSTESEKEPAGAAKKGGVDGVGRSRYLTCFMPL